MNPNRRSLFALHRDVLRTMAGTPLVFILAPMALWLPFDLGMEWVSRQQASFGNEFRLYIRMSQVVSFFLGTYISGLVLVAMRRLGRGETAELGDCARTAGRIFPRLLGVTWSAGWRVGLATLCLLIPGLVLMVRYSLALPAAVWEKRRGVDALDASKAMVRGQGWRLFGAGLWVYVAWLCAFLFPMALFYGAGIGAIQAGLIAEFGPPMWLDVLIGLPGNLLPVGLVVGGALVYRDHCAPGAHGPDAPPIGPPPSTPGPATQAPASGVVGVVLISLIGLLSLAIFAAMASLESR